MKNRIEKNNNGFKPTLILYLLLLFLSIGCNNKINHNHIYYLHGRIVEEQGKNAVSEKFGKYELDSILNEFKDENTVIHCEIRKNNTDVKVYANKISKEIDSLINSGVKPNQITVIGASKGAIIAQNISNINTYEINYIFLAGNNQILENENDWKFHGRVLCFYDNSDSIAGKNYDYWKQRKNYTTAFEQIEINMNLGHGFLYKPFKEWIVPTKEWIKASTK
jgi:hypothetical protein